MSTCKKKKTTGREEQVTVKYENMNFFSVTDEFTKNPELKEEDLNHLRGWISKQPHLPKISGEYFKMSNLQFLLIYLIFDILQYGNTVNTFYLFLYN